MYESLSQKSNTKKKFSKSWRIWQSVSWIHDHWSLNHIWIKSKRSVKQNAEKHVRKRLLLNRLHVKQNWIKLKTLRKKDFISKLRTNSNWTYKVKSVSLSAVSLSEQNYRFNCRRKRQLNLAYFSTVYVLLEFTLEITIFVKNERNNVTFIKIVMYRSMS